MPCVIMKTSRHNYGMLGQQARERLSEELRELIGDKIPQTDAGGIGVQWEPFEESYNEADVQIWIIFSAGSDRIQLTEDEKEALEVTVEERLEAFDFDHLGTISVSAWVMPIEGAVWGMRTRVPRGSNTS